MTDIGEDLIRVYKHRSWTEQENYGIGYTITLDDFDMIPTIICQMDVIRAKLLKKWDKEKFLAEKEWEE